MLAVTLQVGLKMAAISSSGRDIGSVLRCPLAMNLIPRVDSSTAYKCILFFKYLRMITDRSNRTF